MTNPLALQHNKITHEIYKTYTLSFASNTDQYVSVNNIPGIKFCLAVELTATN